MVNLHLFAHAQHDAIRTHAYAGGCLLNGNLQGSCQAIGCANCNGGGTYILTCHYAI